MTKRYDAVVIGAGHNGLVCAAYLAKAGKSVLVLERRHLVGGATVTEEVFPGFKFSVCSYVVSLMRPRIISELDLPSFGFELLPLDGTLSPTLDGDYLMRWHDAEETRRELTRFSTADAEAYEQFGKLMSLVEPRLAVGYHFYNDFDTEPEVRKRVRKTYDGPLDLAVDYMVWNVTKDDIRVRMSAYDEEVWPSPALLEKRPPDFTGEISFSDFTMSGVLAFPETVQPLYDEINEIYGTDFKPGLN